MKHTYTAKLYIDKVEIESQSGSNVEELYTWMLTNAQGKFGNIHGDIIDDQTGKLVKSFRKSPPD